MWGAGRCLQDTPLGLPSSIVEVNSISQPSEEQTKAALTSLKIQASFPCVLFTLRSPEHDPVLPV